MEQLVSQLEAGQAAAFEQLVAAIISQDNAVRKQGEEAYQHLIANKADLLVQYLSRGLSHAHHDMTSFCAVYLRKAVRSTDVWESCSPATQELAKKQVIDTLGQATDKKLMHKLADTASQIAAQTWEKEDGRWLGVLQHMQQFIQSGDERLIETALVLFAELTEWLGAEDVLRDRAGQMYNLLLQYLGSTNMDIACAACKASGNFIMSIQDEQSVLGMSGLVRCMIDVVAKLLQKGDELEAREVLVIMCDLVEDTVRVRLVKPALQHYLVVLFHIANNAEFDPDTRQTALELVVLIVVNRPGMIRNNSAQVQRLCQTCMVMLLEVEDVPEWHTTTDEQDVDQGHEELHECAMQVLDRIARPIGPKALLAALWPIVEAWARDADWRKRHAALCCICQVAEGCKKLLLERQPLTSLVTISCSAANDSQAQVQWASSQAIGQACTDLGPRIQTRHHADVMKALLSMMQPGREQRVQAHAASAVVNFCEPVDGNVLGPYMQPLIDTCIKLLSSPSQLVVEAATNAISAVADATEELFRPFYGAVMPLMQQILGSAAAKSQRDKSQRRLVGKVLECISLMGLTVGKDMFYKDAAPFINYLHELNNKEMDPDDPILTYVQSAGTRMCKCLGDDFVPLMDFFIPPLIRSAAKQSTLETFDQDDVDVDEDDEDYEFYPVGDKVLRISTAHSQEKQNALQMLACYAEELKAHFAPYCAALVPSVEHVLDVPLLNSDDMRSFSARIVPSLVESMQLARDRGSYAEATDANIATLFTKLITSLNKAIRNELEHEVLHSFFEALESTVDLVDDALVTNEVMTQCFESIDLRAKDLLGNREARQRLWAEGEEDMDAEDVEQMKEEHELDSEVLQQIVSAIGAFLRKAGDRALPFVESLMTKYFNAMLAKSDGDEEDEWMAMLLIADVVEFAPSSSKYLPQLMPKLMHAARSTTSKELATTGIFTLGIVAEKHPSSYEAHHKQVLDIVCHAIKSWTDEGWAHAHDNAVAALGRILRYQAALTASVGGAGLGAEWLQQLPIKEDEVEAGKQHRLLKEFVEANDARIIGEGGSNVPKIGEVFVRVIARGEELLENDYAPTFVAFFKQQLVPVLERQGVSVQSMMNILKPGDRATFADRVGVAA